MSIREKIEDLERKVKSQLSLLTTTRNTLSKFVEENKNLKELNKQMQENYDNLNDAYSEILDENKNLKEKVETLELWLNNKEKLNEAYRKEIDKLKIDLKLYENAY